MLIQIEDDDGQVVVFAQTDGGGVHHLQPELQNVHIGNVVELPGAVDLQGVGIVDSVNLGGLQNHIRLDLHGAQGCCCVRRKIRVPGPAGENHDAAFFQM